MVWPAGDEVILYNDYKIVLIFIKVSLKLALLN